MKLPQHIVYDHLADKSLPRNLHSPALLPTAYSSPRWAGSMTTSSPYSATPVLDHIEPKEHNVSPINSQVIFFAIVVVWSGAMPISDESV